MNKEIQDQLDLIHKKWPEPPPFDRIPVVVSSKYQNSNKTYYGIQFWTPQMIKAGQSKNTDNTISKLAATPKWYKVTENKLIENKIRKIVKNKLIENKIRKIVKNKLHEGEKRFDTMHNVGKARYVINYHDGEKTHKDGSDFKDIAIFSNKKDYEKYRKYLLSQGYKETN